MGADDLKSTISKLKKSRAEPHLLKILVEEVERRRKGGKFQKLTLEEMHEAVRDRPAARPTAPIVDCREESPGGIFA